MNLAELLKENNVTPKTLIEKDVENFFKLPYGVVKDILTIEEQLALITDKKHIGRVGEMRNNLIEFSKTDEKNINLIDPKLLTASLFTKWSSFYNCIMDVINIVDKHEKRSEIIVNCVENYEKFQNEVSNLINSSVTKYNLIIKHLDSNILNAIAINSEFGLLENDVITYIIDSMPTSKQAKLLKENAYNIVLNYYKRLNISNSIGEYKSWHSYSIPENLIKLCTQYQLISIFSEIGKHNEVSSELFNRLLRAKFLSKDSVTYLVNSYGFELSSNYSDVIEVEVEIEPNLDDPFSHVYDDTIRKLHGTAKMDALKKVVLIPEIIYKDVRNLSSLSHFFHWSISGITDEEILSIFENTDYIQKVINHVKDHNRDVHYVKNLLIRFALLTSEKEKAFKLAQMFNYGEYFQIFQSLHEDIEYFQLLFKLDENYMNVIENMLKWNNRNILEALS